MIVQTGLILLSAYLSYRGKQIILNQTSKSRIDQVLKNTVEKQVKDKESNV
jgi:hypothetical protein